MKNTLGFITSGLLSLAIIVALLYVFKPENDALASVQIANEYRATTTATFLGWTAGTAKVLNDVPGGLGSVVITGANTGTFELYDATTTNALLRTNQATTTLATFPTNAAAGTYTFDIVYKYGLIVQFTTNVPTTTITFR